MRGVTQSRWDYVNVRGFGALTVALALQLPGDYPPLEGPGVTDKQESVAGLSGHSLLTAFSLKCGSLERWPCVRWGVRESVTDLLRHSLPAKGGIEGCWSGCLVRSTAENQTDRRASTFVLLWHTVYYPVPHKKSEVLINQHFTLFYLYARIKTPLIATCSGAIHQC